MVLHHLHVHEFCASLIRERHAIAGANQGVCARLKHPPNPTGGHDDRFRSDDMNISGANLHQDGSSAPSILDDQGEYEPLLIDSNSSSHYLFVQNME